MHLGEPTAPVLGQVGEDGHPVDQVEGIRGKVERRLLAIDEEVELGEVRPGPLDALGVDVAAVKLRRLRLARELGEGAPRAAAEVQHALGVPGPVRAGAET